MLLAKNGAMTKTEMDPRGWKMGPHVFQATERQTVAEFLAEPERGRLGLLYLRRQFAKLLRQLRKRKRVPRLWDSKTPLPPHEYGNKALSHPQQHPHDKDRKRGRKGRKEGHRTFIQSLLNTKEQNILIKQFPTSARVRKWGLSKGMLRTAFKGRKL